MTHTHTHTHQFNDQDIVNLQIGIINRAVQDYEQAIMDKKKSEMARLEKWFTSEWGQQLSNGIDGHKIIEVCRVRAKYKLWRKDKKCSKCKRITCIHRRGEHFTAMEKGDLHCLKEGGSDE